MFKANEADKLQWVAHYRDGGGLKQVMHDGSKNAYGDIDRDKLETFELVNRETGDRVFMMEFEPGQQLVWRRRVLPQNSMIVHFVGKREKRGSENYQSIAAVYQNGRVELAPGGKLDNEHPWLTPPKLHESEGEV